MAEKAAKDAKFAAKQASAAAAAAAAKLAEAEKGAAGNDKKASLKAEAEAKKVSWTGSHSWP